MTKSEKMGFDPVEDAIAEIANGNMVIVTDDESRENEGDLIMAASKVTPEAVNKMIVHGRGLICGPAADFGADRHRWQRGHSQPGRSAGILGAESPTR